MKTLCIFPCGNRKIWDANPNVGPTIARQVYIGPFATKCRKYAEFFYPASLCILSAKHGFLFPDDIIHYSYNVSFNDRKTNPIMIKELSVQVSKKGLNKYDTIVVLGGKNYVKIVNEVFPIKKIHNSLRNCQGIRYMMGVLNNAISKGIPL